jgi:hypothetical protein
MRLGPMIGTILLRATDGHLNHQIDSGVLRTSMKTLFSSAKTIGTMAVPDDLVWDALIQLSLDRNVSVIEFIPSTFIDTDRVELDAIVGVKAGDNFVLEVAPSYLVGTAAMANFKSLGFQKWSLTQNDILCDPKAHNARIIWDHRGDAVPVGLRMEIVRNLQTRESTTISQLAAACGSGETYRPVFSLACSNVVNIEFSHKALGPETVIRLSKSRAPATSGT